MSRFQFKNKLTSFNRNNSSIKTSKIINILNSGKSIALVSDAGMPSICDPGEDLIREARTKKLEIICIPGPCAALTALVSSGLPSSKFTFEGFFPKKSSERKKLLSEITKSEKTTILYESPNRLKKLLTELNEYCGGHREIHVYRELTKKFEEHIGNNIKQVIDHIEGREIKGEITIIIKGIDKNKQKTNFDEYELKKELNDLITAGLSLSKASAYLAKRNNITKNKIYNIY